ncbi:MAG: phosphopantetheine-binding protein [Desulfovibrio sp.]
MTIFSQVQDIVSDILDIDPAEISEDSYLIRDLDAESIDLLEFSIDFGSAFGVVVNDDLVFLRTLRTVLVGADEADRERADALKEKYPWLTSERIQEILHTIDDGPVLRISDIVAYFTYLQES